jgi:hypothetical protein
MRDNAPSGRGHVRGDIDFEILQICSSHRLCDKSRNGTKPGAARSSMIDHVKGDLERAKGIEPSTISLGS